MTIEELAEIMHDKLCTYNHTDGCSWYFEGSKTYPVKDKWTEAWAHKTWKGKAEKVRAGSDVDIETIAKVVKAL